MSKYLTIITLFVLYLSSVCPSNILVVSPAVSKSHFNVGEAIAVGLGNAGHNVTIISPFDYKPKISNIENVQIMGLLEKAEERMKQSPSMDLMQKMPVAFVVPVVLYFGADLCEFTLNSTNVKELFNRKYDLVIIEIFGTESLLGLGQQFNAPVIGFSTFSSSRWTNDLVGNPSPLSYITHPMLDYPDRMNLWHRICNTLFYVYESIVLHVIHHPLQRSVYNSAFPNAKLTYDEIIKNVSLIFINSHFSLARPLPYLPNTIEVGGMHVNRNSTNLPNDIKEFIDSAKDGVLYFSFGSFLKSADISIDKRDILINAFAKLKQKIIWKFEDETVKMPSNVYTSKWLPQSDILGHPNIKAFISHGGLLGSTEAIYHGVPIIGVPFFGDQRLNVKRASQAGWAIELDYNNITSESVEWALDEILNNKKYSEKAKEVSLIYRDQPMTPTDTMVYWSEYIIRHKGAPHFRNVGLDLNYIQYHNIDVYLILLAAAFSVFYCVKMCIVIFSKKVQKKVEKKLKRKKNR